MRGQHGQGEALKFHVIAVAAVLGLTAVTAVAVTGDRDPAFSGDGRVISPVSGDDHAWDMVAHRGKLVVVGSSIGRVGGGTDAALLRYNANGALDRTFGGGDGVVTTHLRSFDRALAVAMQGDKILVAGATDNSSTGSLLLMRYRPNGALDKSFSGDGKVTLKVGSIGEATAVALQGDKILVAGWGKRGDIADVVLARYTIGGALDNTFGQGGTVVIDYGDNDHVEGLAVQGERIVVGGHTLLGGDLDFFAMRFDANGNRDTSFSGDGVATISTHQYDVARALAVQPDGGIIVGGFGHLGSTAKTESVLVRFATDGQPDPSFGGSGVVVTPSLSRTEDVLLHADGRIVTVGRAFRGGRLDMAVARYTVAGGLDPSLSGDGKAFVNFGREDSGVAGAILASGKLAIAGEVIPHDASFGSRFAAARILLGAP